MRVVTLEIDFRIPGATSLKDKRRIVKSLKDRIRARFPVAVAETGSQDLYARAMIGVAAVGGESGPLEHALDEVQRLFESDPRLIVVEALRERY
jgi:uncharacterized protein YlxP (DUF503 family)